MAYRKVKDVLAANGEYVDQQGQQKTRWIRVGTMLKNDQSGQTAIKMDCLPIGAEFDGWLVLKDPQQPRDGEQKRQARPQRQQDEDTDGFRDDDIPF